MGGLAWATDNESLKHAFSAFGEVVDGGFSHKSNRIPLIASVLLPARVVVDRETGRSRGFGFVTFRDDKEAEAAVQGLHEKVSNNLCLLKIQSLIIFAHIGA